MSDQINFPRNSQANSKLLLELKEKPYIEYNNGAKLYLHELRQSGFTSLTTEYIKQILEDDQKTPHPN